MKWNTKALVLSAANCLFAGLAGLAQNTNSDSNTDNAGTKTAVAITHDDGLLYAPTYEECMKSGQAVVTRTNIYFAGWTDLNKNGKKDVYEDSTQPIDKRVEDLLSQMTLEEKTAQLATLYGYKRVLPDYLPTTNWHNAFWHDGVANIDEDLTGYPYYKKDLPGNAYIWPASKHVWALNEVQRFFIEDTRLGVPAEFTDEGIRGVEHARSAVGSVSGVLWRGSVPGFRTGHSDGEGHPEPADCFHDETFLHLRGQQGCAGRIFADGPALFAPRGGDDSSLAV